MKLHFLGTGTSSGVPQMGCSCRVCRSSDPRDQRTRTSALLETDDGECLLLDCGPDFRSQMLRFLAEHPQSPDALQPSCLSREVQLRGRNEGFSTSLTLPDIAAVLITHEHFDHVGGLDDLRPFSVHRSVEICAEPHVAASIRRHMAYCFNEQRYPGSPHLTIREVYPDHSFCVGNTEIQPIRVLHGQLPIVGYRFEHWAYLTDVSVIPPEEWHKLEGITTLVINGLRHTPHPTHQSISEAIRIAEHLQVQEAYLIHFSHDAGLHAETSLSLPPHIYMAYDGLTIHL